jgi:hypothetical protein
LKFFAGGSNLYVYVRNSSISLIDPHGLLYGTAVWRGAKNGVFATGPWRLVGTIGGAFAGAAIGTAIFPGVGTFGGFVVGLATSTVGGWVGGNLLGLLDSETSGYLNYNEMYELQLQMDMIEADRLLNEARRMNQELDQWHRDTGGWNPKCPK